jgi:hypothetical protein
MPDANAKLGGFLAMAGSAAVVLITGIYASAPTAANAPLPGAVPMADALAATVAAAGRLQAAGTIGIVGDAILIGGCALLALRGTEPPLKRLFWIWLGLSTAIFIAVDGLAAAVLPDVARGSGADIGAYALGKRAFDLCFALGVFVFGAALLVAAAERSVPQWLRLVSLVAGLLSVAGFLLHVAGTTLPLLFGAAVGLVGVLGVVFGYRETRS